MPSESPDAVQRAAGRTALVLRTPYRKRPFVHVLRAIPAPPALSTPAKLGIHRLLAGCYRAGLAELRTARHHHVGGVLVRISHGRLGQSAQVGQTYRLLRLLSRALERREQNGNQQRNNRYHHQQLNQRETHHSPASIQVQNCHDKTSIAPSEVRRPIEWLTDMTPCGRRRSVSDNVRWQPDQATHFHIWPTFV